MKHHHPSGKMVTLVHPGVTNAIKILKIPAVEVLISDIQLTNPPPLVGTPRYNDADPTHPLVLLEEAGKLRLIDGRHRLHKLVQQGATSVKAYIVDWDIISPYTYHVHGM